MQHVLAELLFKFVSRGDRIFEGIVEEARNDGGHIRFKRGEDSGDRDGMLQVGFSGAAPLPFMGFRREFVGLAN